MAKQKGTTELTTFNQEAIQNFVAFADVLKRIHIRMASVENAIVDEPKRSVGNFPGVCDNVGVNNKKLKK